MRKLAWFTGGFAGMCLAGCYVPELLFPILAVLAVLIPAALGLRLAAGRICSTPPPWPRPRAGRWP